MKRAMSRTQAWLVWMAAMVLVSFLLVVLPATAAEGEAGTVVNRELRAQSLVANRIGVDPLRRIAVYLPAGYDGSNERYPVIYFFPNPLDANFRSIFDQQNAQELFDRAITNGVISKFILVCVDMSTPLGSSWYVDSPVTGKWEDFVLLELVPYIDTNFRTLANRDSRGIAGAYLGAYGALRFAIVHADVFGVVYGMNPVGTGSGVQIMDTRPNWDLMATAKSLDDVKNDGFSTVFTSIFQAFLPDPQKPPLFVDLPARRENGQLVIDAGLTGQLRNGFFLESLVPGNLDNLKSLKGIKFDWSRSDMIWDHVYANQAFTHELNEFGIVHEAEEYNGAWGEPYWGKNGRVYNEVLPFFREHLVFGAGR